ncbi:NAD(+) synthase [Howardella ureilytica]|nr:NAD(+) synthase [Lachnospiraceae bacterium]MDY2956221.1 NAD(+) synthase [Lachnospiraceae bacterium]
MLKEPSKTKEKIVEWIKEYFESSIPDAYAVIGISGGKDSSIAAALCAEALGSDRVVGVIMPDGEQNDIDDSYRLTEYLRIKHVEINIKKITAAYLDLFESNDDFKKLSNNREGISRDAKINMPPRIRMSVLYGVAQSLDKGGLVVNTCNYSEDFVGYSTKYGDSAGDFSPLSSLTVSEVLQIGKELNLPDDLIYKTPSDGLSGSSDEEKLGFTYEELEKYIYSGDCDNAVSKERIERLHIRNLHKILPMPAYNKSEDEIL